MDIYRFDNTYIYMYIYVCIFMTKKAWYQDFWSVFGHRTDGLRYFFKCLVFCKFERMWPLKPLGN